MPKQKTDDLIQLIRSLTKAEKRHFRLLVLRHQSSEESLFLQLFDLLDKQKVNEEEVILKKLPNIKKQQLPNVKAHLYRQLLTSLRLLNKNHNEDIQIRETIDYARVLYNKGLYRQSLDMLAKVKDRALQGNFSSQALEIVEFEKLIEGQYITRSIEGRAEALTSQSVRLIGTIQHTNEYSNLSLQMYALYLKTGFVRNQKDYYFVREFFQIRLPETDFADLNFWGKVYYCQAYLWKYHICQEFAPCYRYAQKWVDLFLAQPAMIALHPPLYLKGLHNLLNTLSNSMHYERFMESMELLDRFPEMFDIGQDKNIEGLFNLYKFIHQINRHYLEGSFRESLEIIPNLVHCIENEDFNWDNHRVMVFYYRIACLYFANEDYDNTIRYLNRIIQQKNPDYREDIQCFARILSLIAHFELGNVQLLEYQIKSVYRFLLQMEDLHEVQQEIFRFLRRTPGMRRAVLLDEFRRLHGKLVHLAQAPFERRPFMYLDIISWLETKLEHRSIQDIVRDKHLQRKVKSEK